MSVPTPAEALTKQLTEIYDTLTAVVPELDAAGVAKLATPVAGAASHIRYLLNGKHSPLQALIAQAGGAS